MFQWQPVATGALALVTLPIWWMNRRDDADMLKTAERLTAVAVQMSPSSERTLLQDMRDQYVVTWVLRRAGNQFQGWLVTATVLYVLGLLSMVPFTLITVVNRTDGSAWWWYGAALIFISAGAGATGCRWQKRRKWVAEEKQRRWIDGRLPLPDRRSA
jgi:hypothetical protein